MSTQNEQPIKESLLGVYPSYRKLLAQANQFLGKVPHGLQIVHRRVNGTKWQLLLVAK